MSESSSLSDSEDESSGGGCFLAFLCLLLVCLLASSWLFLVAIGSVSHLGIAINLLARLDGNFLVALDRGGALPSRTSGTVLS